MMSLLGTIIIGFFAGLIARAIKPGKDAMGWIMTIVLGIAGSILAKFGGQALGFYQPDEPAGFIAAVIGAIILLVIWGLVSKKR